jgi:uncharacterized protein HemY
VIVTHAYRKHTNPRHEPLYILWPYLTPGEQQMVIQLMRARIRRKEEQPPEHDTWSRVLQRLWELLVGCMLLRV